MKNPIQIGEIELQLSRDFDSLPPLADDLNDTRKEYDSLDDDARVKHVYACAGLAFYYAQCLEAGSHALCVVTSLALAEDWHPKTYEELDQRLSKQTLGWLLRRIQKLVTVNEAGVKALRLALDRRNSLVHGYFFAHAENFLTKNGQVALLDDLLDRIHLFRLAGWFLEGITKTILEQYGVTEKLVRELYDKMVREAQDSEND